MTEPTDKSKTPETNKKVIPINGIASKKNPRAIDLKFEICQKLGVNIDSKMTKKRIRKNRLNSLAFNIF